MKRYFVYVIAIFTLLMLPIKVSATNLCDYGLLSDYLSYQIYTRVAGCYGKMLTTRYVTFPNYNEFSTDEVCIGAEEFSLCQRWGAVAVDYDTFVAEVNAYKNKKAIEKNKIVFNNEKTFWEKVFIFVGNYYVYLVSLVVIIILFISALKKIFVKKNQFDFKV